MRVLSLLILFLLPISVFAQSTSDVSPTSIPLPILFAGGPNAPVISSTDYTNESSWYAPQDITFTWELPDEVVAVAVDLATSTGKEPMTTYRPPISSITVPAADLTEGTHYLVVQFRNSEKWGAYSERLIKVDATAPEAFDILVEPMIGQGGGLIVSFDAKDSLSGISHYELIVNNGKAERVNPADARRGTIISTTDNSRQNIKVVAYDQAGNSREASVVALGVASASLVNDGPKDIVSLAVTEPGSILAAVMGALLLLMFGYMVHERQRYALNLRDLRRETSDIHDQLLRIFSALREEIHDQIRGISNKKKITKGEQSAIDGLHKALSVSESLIEREIKDVKNLLEE